MKNITYIGILMSAGLILPAGVAHAQSSDECWSGIAQYDSNSDGILDRNEFTGDADSIFAALGGDNEGRLSREAFENCFLGSEQARTDLRFEDLDSDGDGFIVVSDLTGDAKAETSAKGAQVNVEQAQANVTVEQAQATVTVEQAQPTVTVEQAQPTVTVEQAQPTVTVEQAQPTVTVEQAQPTVTVEQAQPTVTVEQAQPTVIVEQAEPTVMVKQAEPTVTVNQAEPTVSVEQGQTEVQIEQSQMETHVEQSLTEVQIEQDQTTSQVDQGQSTITEMTGGSFDLTRYSADQLIGTEVETLHGKDLGDIEDVVIDGNNEIFFVIDVGGLLGFGETRIAIPAKDVQVIDDKLVLQTDQSEADLKRLSEYKRTEYAKHSW